MLIISTTVFPDMTFDPDTQSEHEYQDILNALLAVVTPEHVKSITASGSHLMEILYGFANIPKPGDTFPLKKYTWTSSFAETIVANILNVLYNGDSFVIKQVKDIQKYDYERWHAGANPNPG